MARFNELYWRIYNLPINELAGRVVAGFWLGLSLAVCSSLTYIVGVILDASK